MGTILPDHVNKDLCEGCADCCKYVAVEIDAPEEKKDHELILRYLMHEGVVVFVEQEEDDDEEDTWFIEFRVRCNGLSENELCGTYETRPNVCREYSPKDCPRNNPDGDGEKLRFTSPEDYLTYLRITQFNKKVKLPEKLFREVRVEIEQPAENDDYDHIAWYLLHEKVNVYNNTSNEWFIEFLTAPRHLKNPGLFDDVLESQAQPELHLDPTQNGSVQFFSERKQFLEYLKQKGAKYSLKLPKGTDRRPPELEAAIPIVQM